MKLTRTQAAWLKNSLHGKNTRPSFWSVFWSARGAWILAVPLCGVGAWWFVEKSALLGCVLLAAGWGFLFTSIMLASRAVNLWPVFREVTDWQKVEALLREHENAT